MTSHPEALYRGVSHAAWGYLFLYLDVNLGTVSILPAFVGYLLFWSAISALEGEVRDLSLLRPLCALLGAWAGAGWLYSWTGGSLDGCFYPLDVILQAASLYFHFQLFTDLALLAARHQPASHRPGPGRAPLRPAQRPGSVALRRPGPGRPVGKSGPYEPALRTPPVFSPRAVIHSNRVAHEMGGPV